MEKLILMTCAIILASAGTADAQEKRPSEQDRIEALIAHIEGLKDAKFIRNGTEYESRQAARFLRGKWKAQGKNVKTADDFIKKVASISSTSGKPYEIRFKDGATTKTEDYLKRELKKMEGN